ncbi:MAG: pyruvate dehydrogenase (acetyl-transferring) E1 component subunit alpha [Candidatus Rokubacteria bacterium]|nr:pyruvate dehydrogenase (acetyl-transferring) E1 component subunit alpha [Candidatus Rokubacteria bacterium]
MGEGQGTSSTGSAPPGQLSRQRLLHLYRVMATIRRFEEVACQLLVDGKIPATLHASIGQEAVAAGVCEALEPADLIVTNHRGHGHCIAKGVDLKAMMAELMGKASGTNRGRGGSMHIADPAQGILGANGIVGGGIPIAVGAAYACRARESGQIVVCFFGDGAANEGGCHEAMNLASLWELPILFVCENNQYAEMTPQRVHTRVKDLSVRAGAYDMPGASVDGNDVVAVYAAVEAAVRRARAGGGPMLIECKTFRVRGHFEGDPQRYKTAEEVARWKEKDPLTLLKTSLTGPGGIPAGELEAIQQEIESAVREAVAFAEAAPLPSPDEVLTHVYAGA